MMLKRKSNPWARLKYAFVLPLAALAVAAFARPEISNELEKISSVKISEIVPTKEISEQKSKKTPVLVQDSIKIADISAHVEPSFYLQLDSIQLNTEEILSNLDLQLDDLDLNMENIKVNLDELSLDLDLKGAMVHIDTTHINRMKINENVRKITEEELKKLEEVNKAVESQLMKIQPDLENIQPEIEQLMKKHQAEIEQLIKEKQPILDKLMEEHGTELNKLVQEKQKEIEKIMRERENSLDSHFWIEGAIRPLYIIDGEVVEGHLSIDPKDIESINILKDASAADLYGEKGKNGVIIIKTKDANKKID